MTNTKLTQRTNEILAHQSQLIYVRTDKIFGWLLLAEWVGGIVAALIISPRTWIGTTSQAHLHVWASIFLGAIVISMPIALILRQPGAEITRHAVAVAQLLMSGLLIHFTGGRIETHFHIFGSLALLAMYRDWRVIVTATVVTAVDHVVRGLLFPQSIYGVLTASHWRWLEHAAWVIFEDFFLIPSCLQNEQEMHNQAYQQASLEASDQASQRRVIEIRQSEEKTRALSEQIEKEKNEATTFINQTMEILERLASRDLTIRLENDLQGDYGRIKAALNTAVKNLCETLAQVSASAAQITVASGQISTGSQSLAQGASEQASVFEEVSANLQDMASVTQQNTANAKKACELSAEARTTTDKGVSSMERLSEAITKIKASADSTAKIVKTIDEIAFQTNLLALNAAVEAARAGDAGKGFAVVADEVRNLAMRSAEAAKNTASLIEESVKNAEDGVFLNQEALHNLEEISVQVQQVSTVMNEIAATSEHQNHGVRQINEAIETISQVTQFTAANAEESSSAAEELLGQANEMQNMVESFKLDTVLSHSSLPAKTFRPAAKSFTTVTGKHKPMKTHLSAASPQSTKGASAKPQEVIPFDDELGDEALQEF